MILTSSKAFKDPYKIEVNQVVRLVLKDQEYIKKLEEENTELRKVIDLVKAVL